MRQTHYAIAAATIELAMEHGLASVTIEQIAERADVSPRTFFNHFSSKEDALLGESLHADDPAELEALAAGGDGLSPYEALRRHISAVLTRRVVADDLADRRMQVLARNPELLLRQMARVAAMADSIGDSLARRLVASAGVAPEQARAEARMLVHVMAAAVHFTGDKWRRQGRTSQPAASIDSSFQLLESVVNRYLPRQEEKD